MPQNPRGPFVPVYPIAARPPAPHVQAAVGAVQAKPAGAPRPAAPHVQAAVGRGMAAGAAPRPVQPKPAAVPPSPAPHVARAMAAAQARFGGGGLPSGPPARSLPLPPPPVPPPARAAVQPKAPDWSPVVQCGKQKSKQNTNTKRVAVKKFSNNNNNKVTKKRHQRFVKFREEVRNSKGPLGHKRYPTAYGAFNRKRQSNLQGPHTMAHIATSAALAVGRKGGIPLKNLMNSAIVPRPRQVNRLARKKLREQNRFDKLKSRVKKFVKEYQDLYTKGLAGDKIAIEKLIEKNPHATYAWDKGKVSSQEIKGKGERRTHAIDDFEKFNKTGSFDNLRTVDMTSGSSRGSEHRYRQLMGLAYGKEDFSEDSGSEESDSDIDLD